MSRVKVLIYISAVVRYWGVDLLDGSLAHCCESLDLKYPQLKQRTCLDQLGADFHQSSEVGNKHLRLAEYMFVPPRHHLRR